MDDCGGGSGGTSNWGGGEAPSAVRMESCSECGIELMAGPEPGFAKSLCGDCAIRERVAEEERRDKRDCPKCFKETRNWGREAWRRDGKEYCKACVKELERVWFIANSCMRCNELIRSHEKRVLPPERIQQMDPYVRGFVVRERAVCWECFEEATKRPFGVKIRMDAGSSTPVPRRFFGGVRRRFGW